MLSGKLSLEALGLYTCIVASDDGVSIKQICNQFGLTADEADGYINELIDADIISLGGDDE